MQTKTEYLKEACLNGFAFNRSVQKSCQNLIQSFKIQIRVVSQSRDHKRSYDFHKNFISRIHIWASCKSWRLDSWFQQGIMSQGCLLNQAADTTFNQEIYFLVWQGAWYNILVLLFTLFAGCGGWRLYIIISDHSGCSGGVCVWSVSDDFLLCVSYGCHTTVSTGAISSVIVWLLAHDTYHL